MSEQEGLPADPWCYEMSEQGDIKLNANYLSLTGYRLPTEAELEYATRAGAVTSRYFGETDELLVEYAWYDRNSHEMPWPVGSLKPNDLGLFDTLGNVWEWCQEGNLSYPQGRGIHEDQEDELRVVSTHPRALHGGSFLSPSIHVRSATRSSHVATYRHVNVRFRVAKTLPPVPLIP